ncbi:MFS transporter [Tardiphaga sp. P9-11]|nr:MFS transporter [Tardiphaga sp. P9-11]
MPAGSGSDSRPTNTGALSQRPLFAVGAVLVGSFLANFDTRLFSVALGDLRGAYSLGYDEGTWLSTATTASQIAVAPAVAWLATVFGLRRVLGWPSILYAVLSLLLPLVHDFDLLITLGILRGLLLGTFVPAALLIIFRNLPMRWWILALAIYSARVGLSLNTVTAVVGFYVDRVGWQWMFWQDALVAPLMALCAFLGTPPERINVELLAKADWGGIVLLGAGMAMVYAGLDQGNRLDWLQSGTVVSLLLGGAALVSGFFVNEVLVEHPWAEVDVIMSRNIGLALIAIVLYALTSLSNAALAPNFLAVVGQLRPEQSGSVFAAYTAVPMLILLPATVYLIKFYDARLTVLCGFSAFAAAGLLGTRLTHAWSIDDFVPMLLLQSIGQSFCLLPLMMIALASSNLARSTAFAAYVQVVRLGGSEFGAALMATWLRVREQQHSNSLGQHLLDGDANLSERIAKLASSLAKADAATASERAVSVIAATVKREANTLSFIDGFWLAFFAAIAGIACIAFMSKPPPGPFTPKPR